MQQQQAKTRSATQAGRRSAVVVSAGLRWFSRPATPQAPIAPSSVRPSPAPLQRAKSTVERALGLAVAVRPAGRLQHVAVLVQDLERALAFYQGTLGLDVDTDRPHNKLPYRGAWLSVGPEMIHLMELPEGGRDRRVTVSVPDIKAVLERLGAAGVPFTLSRSGSRPAAVLQDPDQNIVEVVEHAYA